MLAAIQSMYASGTLSMKVEGTAGLPQVQRITWDATQGCPLSPTLFVLFFYGLHEHLSGLAPAAVSSLLSRSGRHVPFLCYAGDVLLLSDSSGGLQRLIDGMHDFCNSSDLVISVARTEVVVFHGSHVQGNYSLQSALHFAAVAIVQVFGAGLSRVWGAGAHVAAAAFCRPGCQASGQFQQVGVFYFTARALEAVLNIGCPCHLLWL